MKKLIGPLALALLLAPQGAFAQGEAAMPHVRPEVSQQFHSQMRTLHAQARSQILGALTPAHRELLANTIGQLAISANPDREAAARSLNAALSPAEAASVLRIHESFRAQMRGMMQAERMKALASMSPQDQAEMRAHVSAHSEKGEHAKTPLDAGHVLLHISGHSGESHGDGPPGMR